MEHWIDLYPGARDSAPPGMRECARRIVLGSGDLRGTQTVTGGLSRAELKVVLLSLLEGLMTPHPGTNGFNSHLLDANGCADRTAASVQAGRAHTNNEALLGVLAAAADPGVDWLILVVPERYKSSGAYAGVIVQLDALATCAGVDLDLKGIAVVAF